MEYPSFHLHRIFKICNPQDIWTTALYWDWNDTPNACFKLPSYFKYFPNEINILICLMLGIFHKKKSFLCKNDFLQLFSCANTDPFISLYTLYTHTPFATSSATYTYHRFTFCFNRIYRMPLKKLLFRSFLVYFPHFWFKFVYRSHNIIWVNTLSRLPKNLS